MNILEIQNQLRTRVASKVPIKAQSQNNAKGRNAIKQISDRLHKASSNATELAEIIHVELNDILKERDIAFATTEEKEGFILQIRPTVVELMQKHFQV